MRSVVKEVNLLPQWSVSITINISSLPSPTIVSSELIKIDSIVNSGGFTINSSVHLTLRKPQESEGFEVWIGGKVLAKYEQPDDRISGVIFQFKVHCKNVRVVLTSMWLPQLQN